MIRERDFGDRKRHIREVCRKRKRLIWVVGRKIEFCHFCSLPEHVGYFTVESCRPELGEYCGIPVVDNGLRKLHRDESGQGLLEYVLIMALVALAAVAGMSSLASSVNRAFSQVGSILTHTVT